MGAKIWIGKKKCQDLKVLKNSVEHGKNAKGSLEK